MVWGMSGRRTYLEASNASNAVGDNYFTDKWDGSGLIWANLGKNRICYTHTDVRLDGFAPNSNANPSPSWLASSLACLLACWLPCRGSEVPIPMTKNLPHRPHLRKNPGKIALSGYYAFSTIAPLCLRKCLQATRIPRRSPIQVLTGLNLA